MTAIQLAVRLSVSRYMPQSALLKHLPTLHSCRKRLLQCNTVDLFSKEDNRAEKFSITEKELFLDFSKNRLDQNSLDTLLQMARDSGLEQKRDAMFAGERINLTENRAVLHTALRAPKGVQVFLDGENVVDQVHVELDKCLAFAQAVRSGAYSLNGMRVRNVVNIGIGGSDLGPVFATRALSPYHDGPAVHFVSNVDGADFADCVANLDAKTTLFIIASKTFTTAETLANATLAKQWLAAHLPDDEVDAHLAALSTNLEATAAFGIPIERTFGFWDWVGGRYSIWSAIGLSLMIAIGDKHFREFLSGGHLADQHFKSAPLDKNIPVIMGLIAIWHRNVWDHEAQAIIPYENRLSRFPAYLQQLVMESNGKHVDLDSANCAFDTTQLVWGEPGTNGQHAFFQMLHQGTSIIPCDFLIAATPHEEDPHQQQILAANCFAQSEALMIGRSLEKACRSLRNQGLSAEQVEVLAPHKVFEGNRPSNTLIYAKLDPQTLGYLVATYEHQVFVQACIWGINAFDQWGVELGKQLARTLEPLVSQKFTDDELSEKLDKDHDPSTANLIKQFRKLSC